MKIRLGILERDSGYLSRFMGAFGSKYADKFVIMSFSDPVVAFNSLESEKIEVFLVNDSFEVDFTKIPKRCAFAYFVDSVDIDSVNNQHAICKYQRADLIYKQIIGIYSENAANISNLKFDDNSTRIIAFEPVSGGVGSSTMAAACAIHFAKKGKRTLYLNLEKTGSSDYFFDAEGSATISDVIYALKKKKTANITMKLESCVKRAQNGVYYFSQAVSALDMLELNAEEILHLLSELKTTGSYDYIIIDMDFSIEKNMLDVYRNSHALVWVSDGSEISNIKMSRAYQALFEFESNEDSPITNRLSVIYNKFGSRTGKILDIGIKNPGGVSRYEMATITQILEQISSKDMFDSII